MKKISALLLALMLVISLIPMMASAAAANSDTVTNQKTETTQNDKPGDKEPGTGKDDKKGHHRKKRRAPSHDASNHNFSGYGYNTDYHWMQYACGCRFNMEPHVDPLSTDDDCCTCGYQFSDNADLVTLWVDGCPPIKGFNKDKTEYKLNAYTYKDVQEIKVSTSTYDSEATVELPEDLTLKNGENKFEVKVIAENQKVTKVYTLIINKEAK